MWTIFFDIDGTLIRTGGAGLVSMSRVMSGRYDVDKLPQVPVHGRTDAGIWRDVFAALELNPPDELQSLIDEYCVELQATLNPETGTELPGVRELLLQLGRRDDVTVCLLTGNAHAAARIKLEAFGLCEYFSTDGPVLVGGFGDTTACRNEVAKLAIESATRCLPRFDKQRTWVIGDTKRDFECAGSIGSKVLAVQTGGDSMVELLASEPDSVVSDLSKVNEILAILFGEDVTAIA